MEGADTDNTVLARLHGERGKPARTFTSGPLRALNTGRGNFMRGKRDDFFFECSELGELKFLEVQLDGVGERPGWHMAEAVVEHTVDGRRWVFAEKHLRPGENKGDRPHAWIPVGPPQLRPSKHVQVPEGPMQRAPQPPPPRPVYQPPPVYHPPPQPQPPQPPPVYHAPAPPPPPPRAPSPPPPQPVAPPSPPPTFKYYIVIWTSNMEDAGTDADVFIQLIGDNGVSPRRKLTVRARWWRDGFTLFCPVLCRLDKMRKPGFAVG